MKQKLIGQFAAEFGVNPRTLRYFETLGLLPTPERSKGGYRLYDEDAVNRLGFISKAKSLGLTLTEFREILSVRDRGRCPCGTAQRMLQAHAERIDRQIIHLRSLKAELNGMLARWP